MKMTEKDKDWFVTRALSEIQEAFDLLNLPIGEQNRALTLIEAIEEVKQRLALAKSLLSEIVWIEHSRKMS